MAKLRAEGLYDRSLIVVTADHGISFRPDLNRRVVVPGNVEDIASVPMFVKQAGQRSGRVDDGAAHTIDLLPTVADAVGVRLVGSVDGNPLGEPGARDAGVKVSSYTGNPVEISFADFVRRRDAEVSRRLRLFGSGGFEDVFASGPVEGLFGRRVGSVPGAGRAGFRVDLDLRSGFASFSPDAASVPAFLTGRLSGGAQGGEVVAIAVNSRIAAVTRSFRDADQIRVGAMVSPESFRPGANRIEAFAVSGAAPALRLARVGGTGSQSASLEEEGDTLVVTYGGRRIPVTAGAADGWVDTVSGEDGRLTIGGWASDPRHRSAAERVMLFAEGRLIESVPPSVVRADVAKQFNSLGVAKAGFRFTGVPAASEALERGDLVVVALSGDGASRLVRSR